MPPMESLACGFSEPSKSPSRVMSRKDHVEMKGTLEKAFGYQGDNMNLPVQDLSAALEFYQTVLGFRLVSRSETPHKTAVLARDSVQIGLAENGGDPTQDGCAFHVANLELLRLPCCQPRVAAPGVSGRRAPEAALRV